MPSHLVISAIAPNRPGMANQVTSLVTLCGCNILESKMKAMGDTFSLVLLAEGEWNAIAKLEHTLPSKASSIGMTTMMQRTEPTTAKSELPYRVKITTLDNPGITKEITSFFADQNIDIQEMSCNTYAASHTGAKVGSIKLTVSLSFEIAVSEVRDNFQKFCARTNLDGSMQAIEH